jgi:hypothetical protein
MAMKRSFSKSQESVDGMSHISKMSTCSTVGKISKNDTVHIDAYYDFEKRAGMKSVSKRCLIPLIWTSAYSPHRKKGITMK